MTSPADRAGELLGRAAQQKWDRDTADTQPDDDIRQEDQ